MPGGSVTFAKPRMNSHWSRSSAWAISGPSIPWTGRGAVMAQALGGSALRAAESRCRLRDAATQLRDLLVGQVLCRNARLVEFVTDRCDRLRVFDRGADLHQPGPDTGVVRRDRPVLRRLEKPAVERVCLLEREGQRDLVSRARARSSWAVTRSFRLGVCELG